ncbi:hypothetical protein [Helicobacter typhlonius]|uniref:hypothetical protein n=1 Tax=Helicobacter typhlonius TaxID=76936 RepID=UPI002FE3C061
MQHIVFEKNEDVVQAVFDVINLKDLPLQNTILLVIGRDGIECAYELAQKIKIPMEFLFTRIIPAPNNPECPIAVVSETMEIIINEDLVNAFEISLDYIYGEAKRQYEEAILQNRYQLCHGRELVSLKNKDVLLFDMGVETGFRMSVAIKTCMNMNVKSLTAIAPIMPKDIYETLGEICDEVCCPYPIEYYVSMAHHFPKLVPLTDEAFEDILNKSTTKDSK